MRAVLFVDRRSGGVAEFVAEAEADDIAPQARQRSCTDGIQRSAKRPARKGWRDNNVGHSTAVSDAAKMIVEIFEFGSPVARDHPCSAATRCPPRLATRTAAPDPQETLDCARSPASCRASPKPDSSARLAHASARRTSAGHSRGRFSTRPSDHCQSPALSAWKAFAHRESKAGSAGS